MEYKTETRYDGNGNPYQVRIPISSNTPSIIPSTPLARTPLQVLDTNPNIANNPTTRLSTTSTNIPTNTTINPLSPTDLDYAKALDEKRALDASEKDKQVLTEEEYKSEALKSLQAEIDAQNALYAGKLSRAKMEGIDRLGQEGAIQARRGLLGSDFGVASTNKVNQANADIRSSIENELALKLEEIRAGARKSGTEKFEAARKAKQEGLNAYITDLQNRGTLNATIADKIASDYFSKNIDPQSDPNYLDQIAKEAGITSDSILKTYNEKVIAKKLADEKRTKEILKNSTDIAKTQQETAKLKAETSKVYAEADKLRKETQDATPSIDQVSKSLQQLSLVKNAINNAKNLSSASGRSGMRKTFENWVVGSTDYTNLVAETNTIRTNVLTLMTDPSIKKFFGPQMSNADVQLMTSAGTTINPELQSPQKMTEELNRLYGLMNRMEQSVRGGGVSEIPQNKPQQMQLPDGRVLNLQPDGTYQ